MLGEEMNATNTSRIYTSDVRHTGSASTSSTGQGCRRGPAWTSSSLPPVVERAGASEAVREIFVQFDQQAQRMGSILRLALVAVMALAVWSGTPSSEWPGQIALLTGYGVLAIGAAWLWIRHPVRARRLRAVAGLAPVDIAAICILQFLSSGGYLMLGPLAFLPFFTATMRSRRAAVMSVAAIIGGGAAVLSDHVFREQMAAPTMATILTMLALFCLCSYAVSRAQERRLVSIAELTLSRSLLLADVMTAEERERRRIAETLHDGALQTLLAARQDLRDAMQENADPLEIARASALLGEVSRDLRQVTRELHPSVLDEVGLAAAVETLVQTFTERTGVPVDCFIDYPHRHRDDATLYGVARELLTNVARHAKALTVRMELHDERDVATLDVQDDGVGMDPEVISRRLTEGHIGLASHRARIETLRGRIDFLPVERGTWVHVELPIRPAEHKPKIQSPATESTTVGPVTVGQQEQL